jgi:hypothetical protein
MAIVEKNILIANRVKGKGDTWNLVNDTNPVTEYASLTEALEAHFQQTKKSCDFRLSPMKGELYAIVNEEDTTPPKKFNLYGDY